MNVPKVLPKPTNAESPLEPYEDSLHQSHSGYGVIPTTANNQLVTVVQSGKTRKQGFHGSFKQAVFMNRSDDGSSKLQVSFTSAKTKGNSPSHMQRIDLPKQGHLQKLELSKQQQTAPPGTVPKIKPKVDIQPLAYFYSAPLYKEGEKRRIQEEVDNLPKPDHLVIAEKELIGRNSIKRFKRDFSGLSRFLCHGCEDSFPTEFSLKDHLDRQSYAINLDCPPCSQRFVFMNKCQMYCHLRTHYHADSSRAVYVAETLANVTIIPRNPNPVVFTGKANSSPITGEAKNKHSLNNDVGGEMPDTMPDDEISVAEESNHQSLKADGDSFDSGGNGSTKLNDIKEEVQAAESDVSCRPYNASQHDKNIRREDMAEDDDDDELVRPFTCSECSRTFETEWTLRTHFTLTSADSKEKMETCMPCHVELPTPCSYKAHMRVHGLTEPFTCPDCGTTMYKKSVFLKHLRLQCLHYSKLSEYVCPGCPETFTDADDQIKHLQAYPQHLRFDGERSYYKCNGCPKAFKSVAAHSKHESCPGAGCTVVHMCNNCTQQTVFRSWNELHDHRSQAHPDLKWIPKRSRMFSCYLCNHKTRVKQGFLDHLLKAHGKKRIEYMCRYCGVEFDLLQALDIHTEACPFKDEALGIEKAQTIVERTPKLSSSSSVTSEISLSNASQPDNIAITSATDKTAPASPTTAATPSGTATTATFLLHTPSFNCHMCAAVCSNYTQLREHVQRRHQGRGMIYDCWICHDRGNTASYYRQSQLDKHMNDAHKIQISSIAAETPSGSANEDELEDERISSKKLKIWSEHDQVYQCCRCDYSSLSADEFRLHIRQHKTSTDSHQCAECGMCFPVQLALRRHLFAVHKVKDYTKYSRQQYRAEYEKQLADTKGKCPVCQKQYDENILFRKHLRTHGMMYINTKRVLST